VGSYGKEYLLLKVDIFIAHAWRVHDEWQSLVDLIDAIPNLTWRNFSVPWHDPALRPSTELGLQLIEKVYVSQIVSVDFCVIILDLLKSKSNARWLRKAIEIAGSNNVPVSAIYDDPQYIPYCADLGLLEPLKWNPEEITKLIKMYGEEAAFRYV
tara:strand:- start:284 stop:748 length:465 start_codon:yes stop_codon:yes gene_type:complete